MNNNITKTELPKIKNTLILILTFLLLFSCKQDTKTVDYKEEIFDVTTSIYPENISKIFNAHGGLDNWNAMQSLVFTMPKTGGDEVTTTNLKSRESLIEMPSHTIGFDGNELWLLQKDTITYKGNPRFYYNLMFYFYTMPFVLADDGIQYQNVEPLLFQGVEYPGIKISYDEGIGESPEDEYILYYDKATHKMAWLAYTVTYFSKVKNKKFSLIKYEKWDTINGLQLPETIQWYVFNHGVVGEKDEEEGSVTFVNAKLSEGQPDPSIFKIPADAALVK